MKKIAYILAFVTTSLFVTDLKAQPGVFTPGEYRDGVYDKENAVNRRFIPYTHLREGDVTWEKRVWREIDMREKINHQLYYPLEPNTSRISYLQVLLKYILSNQIIAFTDEEFLVPMELSAIRTRIMRQGDSLDQVSFLEDGTEVTVRVLPPADSLWMFKELRKITLKEDWFFDKQKSTLESRIIGMGIVTYDAEKELPFTQFWVYFPACRMFFAKHESYNPKNDSERRTYDDIFWKRQFASTIIKESNAFDRRIDEYSRGIDALLESDRVKGDIFKWEHDLWQF